MNSDQSKTSPDRLLFYAFLVLFIWLPLPLGSNRSWAISLMELWVFSLSIGWLVLFYQNKVQLTSAFRQSVPPLLFFLLFVLWVFIQSNALPAQWIGVLSSETLSVYQLMYEFLGINAGSVPLSLNPYETYETFLESLSYFLIFCLMLLLLKNTHRIRLFAGVVVLSAVFQAVYGSVMTLSGIETIFFFEKEAYRGVATGTFINRNHLAGYLEMALAIGIGFLISTLYDTGAVNWREFFRRIIDSLLGTKARLRIGLALMVIALVLTHSRMGNTAFFTSLTVMGLLYLVIVKKPPRSVMILFVSLLVIDLFIVGAWFGIDKVAERLENTTASRETRDEVVRDTMTMIKDYPLTGTGGGTYDISFLRYRGDDVSSFYNHAHNDYMEFMAEFGLIGMILLGLLVFSCFASALMAQRQRNHALLKGMGFASGMGIVSLMIHSAVDFNLQIPANTALFVALLALGQVSLRLKLN